MATPTHAIPPATARSRHRRADTPDSVTATLRPTGLASPALAGRGHRCEHQSCVSESIAPWRAGRRPRTAPHPRGRSAGGLGQERLDEGPELVGALHDLGL